MCHRVPRHHNGAVTCQSEALGATVSAFRHHASFNQPNLPAYRARHRHRRSGVRHPRPSLAARPAASSCLPCSPRLHQPARSGLTSQLPYNAPVKLHEYGHSSLSTILMQLLAARSSAQPVDLSVDLAAGIAASMARFGTAAAHPACEAPHGGSAGDGASRVPSRLRMSA